MLGKHRSDGRLRVPVATGPKVGSVRVTSAQGQQHACSTSRSLDSDLGVARIHDAACAGRSVTQASIMLLVHGCPDRRKAEGERISR